MIKSEFDRAKQNLKTGDKVGLTIRGNYHEYQKEGRLVKIEHGRVYLNSGFARSYKRIISMSREEALKK